MMQEEILQQFKEHASRASMHYADDSTREWDQAKEEAKYEWLDRDASAGSITGIVLHIRTRGTQ